MIRNCWEPFESVARLQVVIKGVRTALPNLHLKYFPQWILHGEVLTLNKVGKKILALSENLQNIAHRQLQTEHNENPEVRSEDQNQAASARP